MHTAQGECSRYGPGEVYIQLMLLGHFDLKYSSRLLMVQEQLVLSISGGKNLKKKELKIKKKKAIGLTSLTTSNSTDNK